MNTKKHHSYSKSSNKSSHKKSGFIRIIAGNWRGRKLPVHDVEGLRPTTDRVKETVFNWLMNKVDQSHCLDCFAGSGSLAFEALSRGAKSVTLIEKDKIAAKQIEQNLSLLNVNNAQLIKGDSLSFLQSLNAANESKYGGKERDKEHKFDLVFIDPPFRQNLATPICQLLVERQLLSPSALIYIEIESELKDFVAPASWQQLKEKTAGQVSFRLYQSNSQALDTE